MDVLLFSGTARAHLSGRLSVTDPGSVIPFHSHGQPHFSLIPLSSFTQSAHLHLLLSPSPSPVPIVLIATAFGVIGETCCLPGSAKQAFCCPAFRVLVFFSLSLLWRNSQSWRLVYPWRPFFFFFAFGLAAVFVYYPFSSPAHAWRVASVGRLLPSPLADLGRGGILGLSRWSGFYCFLGCLVPQMWPAS
jgi:hypothetical protein